MTLCLWIHAGAELRNWLLFYSVPVLQGILPQEFLSHLVLLVVGVYIFFSHKITEEEFLLGQCVLRQFYSEFSVLYAPINGNPHLLYLGL